MGGENCLKSLTHDKIEKNINKYVSLFWSRNYQSYKKIKIPIRKKLEQNKLVN